jgi:hypothetical protein
VATKAAGIGEDLEQDIRREFSMKHDSNDIIAGSGGSAVEFRVQGRDTVDTLELVGEQVALPTGV